MGPTGGTYFIKLIFDINIEFGILEILDGPNFKKLFLTLYEQLIIGNTPMNFYISTNYFKIICEDIISYDIDNSKLTFSFRVSNSEILLLLFFQVSNSLILF